VGNQPPPLVDRDLFADDVALVQAVVRHGAADSVPSLHRLGRIAGSAQTLEWARQADTNPPELHTHDRYGNRIDQVEFHPAWHKLMETSVSHGLHAAAWIDERPAPHVTRAAGFYLMSQVEAAHGCPISMTYAAVPALQVDPEIAAHWVPELASTTYPHGALAGMAMTEKQGGSDVRANVTQAVPTGEDGWYALTGHKWFCSAPMNDVFLMLAQAKGGLTCFVVPRARPDGTSNGIHLQRLKDKLGDRANASAEIEFDGALGQRLGDEGRGVATIIEMVAATRLDCVLGSMALMRRAVAEASWHAAHRRAFGQILAEAPLMRNVLADLTLESEAATALAMRLAAATDAASDPAEQAFRRLALPVAKYWVCKRALGVVGEALECLGGNGYVEDSGMPRLLRESPLNSIWEGASNIQALDMLRVLSRSPEGLDAWRDEVTMARGQNVAFDRALDDVDWDPREDQSRVFAQRLAVLLQASLLIRYSTPEVADAFCVSRLPAANAVYGTLPQQVDTKAILTHSLVNGGYS
jgi:putative acyl-CoA dehydrogenase